MKKLVTLACLLLVGAIGCITVQAPSGTTPTPTPTPTPTTPPEIVVFSASPTSISSGGSVTLSWNVSNATSVTIDQGVGAVASVGTTSAFPTATTNYILMATNAAGKNVATCQVMVSGTPSAPTSTGLPVINSFTANPPSISAGSSVTLSWNVSNATSVTIDQGVGAVASVGTTSVFATATTNYILMAINGAGKTVATAQVTVTTGAATTLNLPVINFFNANPSSISSGGSSTLTWNVSNATSVTIEPGIGAVSLAGSRSVSPTVATVYMLTATNTDGSVNESLQITITIPGVDIITQPPIVHGTALPLFKVTDVQMVTGLHAITRSCPATLTFSGTITTNTSGTVNYYFEQSDGSHGPARSIAFEAAGTKNVTHSWTVSSSGSYGARLRISSPNEMVSSYHTIGLTCETGATAFAVTSVTASVNPSSFTGACPKTFTFSGVITANGAGTVTYRWESSDGTIASIQSITFAAAGSQTVTRVRSYSWNPGESYSGWYLVRILTPNSMVSNKANLTLHCAP